MFSINKNIKNLMLKSKQKHLGNYYLLPLLILGFAYTLNKIIQSPQNDG